LKPLLSAAVLAALLGGSAWLAQDAAGNFAASPGFSGRNGATCLACHTVAPVGHVDATAVLEGLPAAWDPGATYHLSIRVEGGPTAMPAPQPQGGLDLSIDQGTMGVPAAMQGLLRLPNAQEITYLPAGTMMRQWQADWTAPGLQSSPAAAHLWLAVLAADGNHVVATNTSDGGERFDSAANLTALVPPSRIAIAAWAALPLAAPTANATWSDGAALVAGRSPDANATELWTRLDGGVWQVRNVAADWRIRLEGLTPGRHTLDYRSEGAGRRSPDQRFAIDVPGLALPVPGRSSPAIGLAPLAAALALAILRRRP